MRQCRLTAVWQQTGDINNRRLMDYMTKFLTLTAALVIALPSIASATCGTRGGPGLRGPDGDCLSWDRVNSVCGSDGSRCQREQVNPLFKQLDTTPRASLCNVHTACVTIATSWSIVRIPRRGKL